MVVGPLLLTAALGAELHVAPVRGDGPEATRAPRIALDVTWDGAPADVEVRTAKGVWIRVARKLSGRATTKAAPAPTAVRVVIDGRVLATRDAPLVWTPADVAAWSGPGLQGASAVDLEASDKYGLWVATARGGAGWWDGTRWRHLDRRALGVEALTGIALADDARWFATADRVVRLADDGATTVWHAGVDLPPTVVHDLDVRSGPTLATDAGLVALSPTGTATVFGPTGCTRLARDGEDLTAFCEGVAVDALTGRLHTAPDDAEVTGRLARAKGAWLTTRDTLWLDDGVGAWDPVWTFDPPLQALHRMGDDMVVGGAQLWLVDDAGPVPFHPASGIPEGVVLDIAAGPRRDKAWVGTTAGVALANDARTATPLPLAPLPAGPAIRQVLPHRGGAAVRTAVGATWLGPGAPAGWSGLAAACPPDQLVALAHVDGTWWSVGHHHAWSLTDGEVTRWDLGQRVRTARVSGRRLVFAGTDGVRWWQPGARVLSPIHRVDDMLDALWLGDTLYTLAQGELTAWTMGGARDPARMSVVIAPGAWLTEHQGGVAVAWPGARAVPMGGTLAPVEVSPLTVPGVDAPVIEVVPDGEIRWVATEAGLFVVRR